MPNSVTITLHDDGSVELVNGDPDIWAALKARLRSGLERERVRVQRTPPTMDLRQTFQDAGVAGEPPANA